MQSQRGNFLMQALLALTLIFAFVPFIAMRMGRRDLDSKMYAATRQVELAQTAARIFIRENANNIAYDTTVVNGNAFADLLEPYGLPLGFVPRTALGQDMVLIINKTPTEVSAHLELRGGDLSPLERAELARRIGFYAVDTDNGVNVGIALEDVYSDVVRRNEPDVGNSGFLTDLDLGGFGLDRGGAVFARNGDFETGQFGVLAVSGIENGRKVRSTIDRISAVKTVFQSRTGAAALSLTRGTLATGGLTAKTVAMFGDTGNFVSEAASVYDFSMSAGRTGFSGPADWEVRGNVVSDKINFSVERIEIDSFINAARGQDVFIGTDELEYSARSGIEVGYLAASNITMRDQTSDALSRGESGAVVIDIRPAGTSVLPDALLDSISNDAFAIIARPDDDDGKTVDCKSVITSLDGVYNKNSLSQYIICQYVYWQRLEKRIDIKRCLMEGRGNCV